MIIPSKTPIDNKISVAKRIVAACQKNKDKTLKLAFRWDDSPGHVLGICYVDQKGQKPYFEFIDADMVRIQFFTEQAIHQLLINIFTKLSFYDKGCTTYSLKSIFPLKKSHHIARQLSNLIPLLVMALTFLYAGVFNISISFTNPLSLAICALILVSIVSFYLMVRVDSFAHSGYTLKAPIGVLNLAALSVCIALPVLGFYLGFFTTALTVSAITITIFLWFTALFVNFHTKFMTEQNQPYDFKSDSSTQINSTQLVNDKKKVNSFEIIDSDISPESDNEFDDNLSQLK